jgi:translation initiation factor 2 beta subunit (eIF-2beta)/eIF-5
MSSGQCNSQITSLNKKLSSNISNHKIIESKTKANSVLSKTNITGNDSSSTSIIHSIKQDLAKKYTNCVTMLNSQKDFLERKNNATRITKKVNQSIENSDYDYTPKNFNLSATKRKNIELQSSLDNIKGSINTSINRGPSNRGILRIDSVNNNVNKCRIAFSPKEKRLDDMYPNNEKLIRFFERKTTTTVETNKDKKENISTKLIKSPIERKMKNLESTFFKVEKVT